MDRGARRPTLKGRAWLVLPACLWGACAGNSSDPGQDPGTETDLSVRIPEDLTPGDGPELGVGDARDPGAAPDQGIDDGPRADPGDAGGDLAVPADPGEPDLGSWDPGLGLDPGSPDLDGPDLGPWDPGLLDPGRPDPGGSDPGLTDPGENDPGPTDPGPPDPGAIDPGITDPGPLDPGILDPGTPDLGASDAGACPQVPEPDPVAAEPLAPMDPAGRVETVRSSGFTDEFLYDGTGLLKIGTRREWGASIVFFGMASGGPGMNATNVIDANDTGREVQIALYDPDRQMQGCAAAAACRTAPETACPTSITYLGWNPVQGGNECNRGSPATTTQAPGVLEAVVQPLFWNPDWQSATCVNTGCQDPALRTLVSDVRYTQRLRFVRTHIVEMQMAVENLSDVEHAPTVQEFPTLYASWGQGGPDLDVILDSTGTQVAVDIPANDGFFYRDFDSPGGFVSLQGPTQEYGVGLYYENRLTQFQAWQKQGVFNNVRARFRFGLPARGVVMARAYLILGSFSTVASEATWLDRHLAPFGVIDEPIADAPVRGATLVRGWALDNRGVVGVEALIDGTVRGTLTYGTSRPDVCRVWPGYPQCDAVGWQGTLDLSGVTPCAHLLEVRARDADGNARVIGRRRIQVVP